MTTSGDSKHLRIRNAASAAPNKVPDFLLLDFILPGQGPDVPSFRRAIRKRVSCEIRRLDSLLLHCGIYLFCSADDSADWNPMRNRRSALQMHMAHASAQFRGQPSSYSHTWVSRVRIRGLGTQALVWGIELIEAERSW